MTGRFFIKDVRAAAGLALCAVVLLFSCTGPIQVSLAGLSFSMGGKLENIILALFPVWLILSYKEVNWRLCWPDYIVGSFFLLLLLSLADYTAGAKEALKNISYLALYICVSRMRTSKKQMETLWIFMCVFMTALAVTGLLNYSFGIYHADAPTRAFTPLKHPNTTAVMLSSGLCLCAFILLHLKNRVYKTAAATACLLISICLAFTFTRTAWIAAPVSIVFAAALIDRKKAALAALIIMAAALTAVLLSQGVRDRAASILNMTGEKNVINRTYYWKSGLKIAAAHPLNGAGLGQTAFMARYKEFRIKKTGENPIHPHNMYIYYAAAAGPLAGVLFLALIAAFTAASASAAIKQQGEDIVKNIQAGVAGALLSFGLCFIAECPAYFSNFMAPFWIILGMAALVFKNAGLQNAAMKCAG